ncbi:Uncharacterised protein [Ectopseudomonas mendocina]|uniref:Uncharacterized protein n=1 Tax=Ectopseudomonas mendocina TaxID=300 RepID=A0A379PRJ7_ECTME|nr:Uncharacterised protein [Pseudomonas mendocina]
MTTFQKAILVQLVMVNLFLALIAYRISDFAKYYLP